MGRRREGGAAACALRAGTGRRAAGVAVPESRSYALYTGDCTPPLLTASRPTEALSVAQVRTLQQGGTPRVLAP